MLKMIIVDDEKIIRETIHSLIDWNSLGIDVAAVCKDGIEAFDCILDEYPDIVMTDIKMPGLSGLDLIEKVRAAQLNTEFIILSGYGEFEFARTATPDCLTIRKSSLMYGIFIFDFFNIIFIFVFHMNYICSSPCYITLSSNFVTNSSVENMLNNRLKL